MPGLPTTSQPDENMRAVQPSIRCALISISIAAVSCAPAVRAGLIIEHYRAALCVEPSIAAGVSPPTRGWNAVLTTAAGAKVNVRGAEMVSGRIVVRYQPDGPEVVAADAGDYVYPSDVRINEARTILVVKATGLAGGIRHETWLYEYDLEGQRQLSRVRVDPTVLPDECAMRKTQ
jgi:hypothetical protein